MTRIKDKIIQMNEFLAELKEIAPTNIDEYKSSLEKKAACERYVEKIVEAATDLAFLIVKIKKFRLPEDDADAFNILSENNAINTSLAARLKAAKGMKNVIAHQYGKINDEIVFEAVSESLEKDMREFIDAVKDI